MPALIAPTTEVHRSFLAAMAEFVAEGRGQADGSMIGHDLTTFASRWDTVDGFREYVQHVRDQALEDAPRPAHHVPSTTLWWVDGVEYLGRIAVRHRLTPALLDVGGHIGYDVRATARRRGYATAMLAAVLPVARELGIERALLTCDETNTASRRVIEANGGQYEDSRGGQRRYWVPTTQT